MAVLRAWGHDLRRDEEEAVERSADAAPVPPAEQVLSLQRSAGNTAVRAMLEARQPARPTLARAPHRAPKGSQIEYQGARWNVIMSDKDKPTMTIQQPTGKKQRRDIRWADEDYWIVRENVGGDWDLRVEGQEDDPEVIRERFDAAKLRAVQMLKDYALTYVQQASKQALRDLTLDDFQVTERNRNTAGQNEACEWKLTWKEGTDQDRPRRTWYFTVDVDDPPPTSDQEPHVGWDARAEAGFGKSDPVDRRLGHIWLNAVPVGRGAFVH